jgi:hypothetical protein
LRHVDRLGSRRALLVLAGEEDLLTRVQRLADAETACCSFFTFTVTPHEAQTSPTLPETRVDLAIEVPPSRADVLEALLARAEQARPEAS